MSLDREKPGEIGGADFAPCPLCGGGAARAFAAAAGARYGRCPECRLIFQHPDELPDRDAERREYELHRNAPDDPGYRHFLLRLAEPLAERLAPGGEGLDYGCGPGPAMSALMVESGFVMADYDPIFVPDGKLLEHDWDFITCTETVEHFHRPGREFARLDGLLRPGGWLGVMTEPRDPARDFSNWWYHRDPTHVCFYEPFTMRWIAQRYGWGMESPSRTVFLFQKPQVRD